MAAPEPRTGPPPPPPPQRRRRSGGWLWPLLALIVLVLLLALLVRACTGDDDDGGSATGGDTAAQTQTGGGSGDGGDGASEGQGGGGTVTLDDLLAAGGRGSLTEFDGRDVEVTDGNVVSVVPDAGFWLGSTDAKVFVEVEDEDGLDDLGLEEGTTVSLLGRIEENIEAETYGLRGDDATLYRDQGAHIAVQAADVETA